MMNVQNVMNFGVQNRPLLNQKTSYVKNNIAINNPDTVSFTGIKTSAAEEFVNDVIAVGTFKKVENIIYEITKKIGIGSKIVEEKTVKDVENIIIPVIKFLKSGIELTSKDTADSIEKLIKSTGHKSEFTWKLKHLENEDYHKVFQINGSTVKLGINNAGFLNEITYHLPDGSKKVIRFEKNGTIVKVGKFIKKNGEKIMEKFRMYKNGELINDLSGNK